MNFETKTPLSHFEVDSIMLDEKKRNNTTCSLISEPCYMCRVSMASVNSTNTSMRLKQTSLQIVHHKPYTFRVKCIAFFFSLVLRQCSRRRRIHLIPSFDKFLAILRVIRFPQQMLVSTLSCSVLSKGAVPYITNIEHDLTQSASLFHSTCPCQPSLHLLITSAIAYTQVYFSSCSQWPSIITTFTIFTPI